jgi:Xaa-Pro aminopeptidase
VERVRVLHEPAVPAAFLVVHHPGDGVQVRGVAPPVEGVGDEQRRGDADAGREPQNGEAPADAPIAPDTLVVVDMGALVDGYCSDCTRTFATGDLGDEAAAVYDLVLGTQVASLERVRAGEACVEVDAFARERITEAGHGERFGHGLGHGVGLEVHEAPTLSRAGDGELRAGNVVTVEPGVYLPGDFGVRIEDLVVVTDDGPEVLSGFPKELTRAA